MVEALRAPRCRSTRSTAAASGRPPGRAGGSSRPRSCAGWRTSAGPPPPAARSGARSRPAAGTPRRAPRPAAAASRGPFAAIDERDRPDRLQVLRDVLADLAVARAWRRARARRSRTRARSASPSTFGSVTYSISRSGISRRVEQVAHPLLPGAQLVLVARVGEREHRLRGGGPGRTSRAASPRRAASGESGVRSSGCSSSSAISSRSRSSYSGSEISGSSST